MKRPDALAVLHQEIVECRACPRLVKWREKVAREKRRAYVDWTYWGKPVPGFGDRDARIVLVGLAPGAHGANRTGRMFTGDRSGDFLFAALHRAGLANQSTSVSRDDGLVLHDAYIVAGARCAPPDNAPTPKEFANCSSFLDREVALLPRRRVFVALGAHAWKSCLDHFARNGPELLAPRPVFSHGAQVRIAGFELVGSYHVSQQNTQTGRLTPAMFDAIVSKAIELTRAASA